MWFTAPGAKVYLFSCNSPVWRLFSIFWIYFYFFGTPSAKKNPRTFFSLKIKSLEKQKCVYKLFLSNTKISYRLNHRITENWQNWNKENSQFSVVFLFKGKVVFHWFFKFQLNNVYFLTFEYTKKKGTREFKYLFLKN